MEWSGVEWCGCVGVWACGVGLLKCTEDRYGAKARTVRPHALYYAYGILI